ncbi:Xylose isomerase domain-containing protein TIM barrel (plasmid) [Gemmatirosa kalamazoonensis]|uniref:Xylose isomerase domain-containing protein TIM barrel n=1 Tax=Gemmatirosa kalamazoonensis TaxID=861299 RepID=W0RQ76_9BACT|nr:sugar phosphate isomerase/epimerase [Gemmatirosa kalamazoonensis]AHG93149.1 Xylose isomerase domain-containing protein TIM barrel [Gemmatirosa kalamazoonensis]
MSEELFVRRTFLRVAAAGTAGAALGLPRAARASTASAAPDAPSAAAPGPTAPVRLGVASYSLRKFPRAKAIEMTKALGVKWINLKSVHLDYDLPAADIDAARREIEAAGLTIVGGGTITFDKDTDDGVRRYFEYAKRAGMPVMVATGAPEVMPRVERFAKQYDIQVAIHNHGPEDKHFPSPYDVLKLVKNMDRRMGLCMDIGHSTRAGADIVQAAADAGPRLLDMHAKDLKDGTAKESQCIVGEGVLPIADLFRQLVKQRYAGVVNLEYEIDADDPLPGMQRSFAYMRGVLAGITPSARKA